MRRTRRSRAAWAVAMTAAIGVAHAGDEDRVEPERALAVPALPPPATRSAALWAALASQVPGLALEDVFAATGLAFRATACANDCPCLEWREEALSVAPGARALGFEVDELDLARATPDAAFARIKASVDRGRAPFYTGPREVGVVTGYRQDPPTFFVRAVVEGEARDEARPRERLAELWDVTFLARAKTPALDAQSLEQRGLVQALAHARRAPARGGCGYLEPPAVTAWGLGAYGLFADKLATDDRGIAGQHSAIAERASVLRASREAAATFLAKAAARRAGAAGQPYAQAAGLYRRELDEGLLPLEKLLAGKDELALSEEPLRAEAARLLAKAGELDESALAAIEGPVLAERGLPGGLFSVENAPPGELEKQVPELAKLAEDPDPDVRLLATSELARRPGPAARAALVRALSDADGPVSEAALAALEARDDEGLVPVLVEAWSKVPRTRARTDRPLQRSLLFALGDRADGSSPARAVLERALEDAGEGDEIPDAIPRWAAELLYAAQGVEAEPALLRAIRSPRATARRAAGLVLDLSGSAKALAALDVALGDEDANVRLVAAGALGRRGVDKALKVALAALEDPSRDVRASAIVALTRCGPHAIPGLVRLLEDPDWRVRANACVVLGRTGGTDELARVAALEKDPEPVVRELALQAKTIIEARAKASAPEEKKK